MTLFVLQLLVVGFTIASATTVQAHMEMASPPPRRSQRNPFVKEADRDYNLNFPLEPHTEFKFPCRGSPAGPSVATLTPGTSFPVQLLGSAIHNGGHCQFSISYDGGKTFVALHTIVNRCMLDGLNFQVPLPATLPGGPAVFAWTWVNASGNRELYMNCADVTVNGPAKGTLKGPKIVVANIPGAPLIGEFGAGADPRVDLYKSQPVVEVGPGLGGGAGQALVDVPTVSRPSLTTASYASAVVQPTSRVANAHAGVVPTSIPQPQPIQYRRPPVATASTIPSAPTLSRVAPTDRPLPTYTQPQQGQALGKGGKPQRIRQEPKLQRPVPRFEYPVTSPSPVPVATTQPVQKASVKNKIKKCSRRNQQKVNVQSSFY